MIRLRCARFLLCVAVVAAACAADATPDAAGPEECASIETSVARLACFDAWFKRASGPSATAHIAGPVEPAAPTMELRGLPPTPPAAGVATHPESGEPGEAAKSVSNFGLEDAAQRGAPARSPRITAAVTGISVDATRRVVAVLDNGQRWQLMDDDAKPTVGETVWIRRAALGSFLMTTASRRTCRVRRID